MLDAHNIRFSPSPKPRKFKLRCNYSLTLKDPFSSESCIEIKIELHFYFHTSLWCLKRFNEGL